MSWVDVMPLWKDRPELSDPARVEALHSLGLVDGAPVEGFERLSHLAAAALGAPTSVVSLVEPERQVFAGATGLPEPWASLRQTPIDHAVCGLVVVLGEVVEIDDGAGHPWLEDSPAVTEFGVRAYLGAPVRHPDGHVLGGMCVMDHDARQWTQEDVTRIEEFAVLANQEIAELHGHRVRSRAACRELGRAFSQVSDAVVVTTMDGVIAEWNAAAADLLGYEREEVVGRDSSTLLAPQASERLVEEMRVAMVEEGKWEGALPMIAKDGTEVLLSTVTMVFRDEAGKPLGAVNINRDAAALERADQAMIQAQKMESLGALAGGLAHDFNNLLTAMLGAVSLLRMSDSPRTPDDTLNLETIDEAAHRAADITGGLLRFARGELARLAEVDLRDVVSDSLRLSRLTLPKAVEVDVSVPDAPVMAEGDAAQLQQAVMNIVMNAGYVMPDGGTLLIALTSDEREAHLSIADTGPGMDEETRSRVFEPFYTTKPSGLGTGLGLPSTYGIVASHRGSIGVDSVPGDGATFTIRLPRLPGPGVQQAPAVSAPAGDLVMVVDDNTIVRRATVTMLQRLGYQAKGVAGGEEALRMVQDAPGLWVAVVLDLVMPDRSGAETFRELTTIRPDLPVVVSSGYAPNHFLRDEDRRRIPVVLHKPFTLERLRRVLAEVGLESPDDGAGQPARDV